MIDCNFNSSASIMRNLLSGIKIPFYMRVYMHKKSIDYHQIKTKFS